MRNRTILYCAGPLCSDSSDVQQELNEIDSLKARESQNCSVATVQR